ncbi:heparin lyase I family protein [Kitasatospora sp. NPDC059327]|uniref:heparin lyase I family protein n=1 Tax=Kitasatospora sp. NPDC059327 TaxID=3346803 RepID=UPI00367BF675
MFQPHHRARRVGALLATLVAVGATSVGPAATAAPTTIPFDDGFESGAITAWPRKGLAGKGAVDVVAAPGGHAGRAGRFTLADDGDSYRAEIATSHLSYGSYRYSFSNYLPQDWVTYKYGTFVSQWHGGATTGPPLVLMVRADRWILFVTVSGTQYDLGPVRLGHWNQWTIDITWSTPTTPGTIIAKLDGTQVGSHQGTNNFHKETVPYHKIGMYRPNWQTKKGHVSSGLPPVVLYYDDISITPIPPSTANPTTTATPPPAATAPSAVTTAPSPSSPTPSAPPSGTSPKTTTPPPPVRPSTTGPAPAPPTTPVSATTAAAAPSSTPAAMNDIPTEADTDDTDNDQPRLAATGSSGPSPLVLTAGGALLAAGLLATHRLRRRNARHGARHPRVLP